MSQIQWDDSYSVDDPILDGHHQQLFRYLQLLQDRATRAAPDPELAATLVRGLSDYTHYHFESEERLMREHEYPGLEEHVKQHDTFRHDIANFREQFGRVGLQLESMLLDYLRDWLTNHILTIDKRFGAYLAKRRKGGE